MLAAILVLEAVPAVAKSTKLISATTAKIRVEKLGVGEHVMVKTKRGLELHGHIVKIDPQTFTLKPDHSAQTEIAYSNVIKVKKNPGPVLWILIGAALVIIIIAVAK